MTIPPLTERRWFADPTPSDIIQFNSRIRQRQRLALLAGALLGAGIVALGVVFWFDIPALGLTLGVNILLVFAVAIFDQLWRRCPRCDYSLVPYLVRIQVDDSLECPRCGLNLKLLTPTPV